MAGHRNRERNLEVVKEDYNNTAKVPCHLGISYPSQNGRFSYLRSISKSVAMMSMILHPCNNQSFDHPEHVKASASRVFLFWEKVMSQLLLYLS